MLIVVSSCLLGNPVRFDGQHKAHDFVTKQLAQFCDYQPLCPEDKAFGTPRPTIHVEYRRDGSCDNLSVIEHSQKRDVTAPLNDVIEKYIGVLKDMDISGVILKSKSPSCGYGSTPIFRRGEQYDTANGLFTEALLSALPELPIIEETSFLKDWQREQFLLHLFAYADMQKHLRRFSQSEELRSFHDRHALLLGLKNTDLAANLAAIVSKATDQNLSGLIESYMTMFKQVITSSVTKEAYANLLSSLLYEVSMCDEARQNNAKLIEQFKNGQELLHSVTRFFKESLSSDQSKLLNSSLLNPYPEELAPRKS